MKFIKIAVVAANGEQVFVSATFNDSSLINKQNLIGVH